MSWNDFTHWLSQELKGSFDVTTGEVVDSVYGSKFTHALGANNTLACNPIAQLLMFGAGQPDAWYSALMDLVLGIGESVTFTYGKRVDYTFGGPYVTLSRGPELHLHTRQAYGWGTEWPVIAADDPEEKSFSQDTKMSSPNMTRLVAAFGQILNLTQTMIELWIRFKYQKVTEGTGKLSLLDINPCRELEGLTTAAQQFPGRMMALIYHTELVNGMTSLGERTLTLGKGILQGFKLLGMGVTFLLTYGVLFPTVMAVGIGIAAAGIAVGLALAVPAALAAVATAHVVHMKDSIARSWREGQRTIAVLKVVLLVLPFLLVAVGATLGTLAALGKL